MVEIMTSRKDTMEIEYELVACDSCENKNFKILFEGNDYRSFSANTLTVVQCLQCGLVFLNPRPKNMADYYRNNCYKKELRKDFFSWLSIDRVKIISQHKKVGRILDIGCGNGSFLLNMRKNGWEVYGNEICHNACDFVRDELSLTNVYSGHLLSIDLPEKYFDVITLSHVLEHLEKPRENLIKINRLLKDDGILIIECPDFSSIHRYIFKDKWQALELPQHLYQFTVKTLKRTLNLSGFEVYKKDFIIDPRVSFVDMKISILRWIGLRKPLKLENKERINRPIDNTNRSISWKIFRFSFNWLCLLLSLVLSCINCKDLFRIYCRKIKHDDSLMFDL